MNTEQIEFEFVTARNSIQSEEILMSILEFDREIVDLVISAHVPDKSLINLKVTFSVRLRNVGTNSELSI